MCLAVPGEILTIGNDDPLLRDGRVRFAGVEKRISLAFVPDAGVGDFVIVHAGFAISVLNQEQAAGTLALLETLPEGGLW